MEKRSLKNVRQTKKYHWPYLGKMTLSSLSIVPPLYFLTLSVIYWMGEHDPATPTELLVPLATVIALLVAGLMVAQGILTAHRVAGPHINFQNTCAAIADGDFDKRIKFRSEDKLEDVEGEFNRMLDTLRGRISELEEEVANLKGEA